MRRRRFPEEFVKLCGGERGHLRPDVLEAGGQHGGEARVEARRDRGGWRRRESANEAPAAVA